MLPGRRGEGTDVIVVPPRPGSHGLRAVLLVVVGLIVLSWVGPSLAVARATPSVQVVPHPVGTASSAVSTDRTESGTAASIQLANNVPSEVAVGTPVLLLWQALSAPGSRATGFAVTCELTITSSVNGSKVPAWVNASTAGPLKRAANGTFPVPSAAWDGGLLNLTVTFAEATSVVVVLSGTEIPAAPAPVEVTVLPDLDHLVLYAPEYTVTGARSNETYWHVRDRFGDPTPGALLLVELEINGSVTESYVPVAWASDGGTGAWVNFTVPGPEGGTVEVLDAAGTALLGPFTISALASSPSSSTATLAWPALVAVVLVVVGGIVGLIALLSGGRAPPAGPETEGEEELRRLAEGRATVVELVRREGSLTLHGIEMAWEPRPAPPAVADWVASLVTDGTLTATLGEGGEARFALAVRPLGEPRVTLDEDALEQGIARRDAALDDDADDGGTGTP